MVSRTFSTSPCCESETAVVSRYSQVERVRNFSGFKDFNISAFGNIFKWTYLFLNVDLLLVDLEDGLRLRHMDRQICRVVAMVTLSVGYMSTQQRLRRM